MRFWISATLMPGRWRRHLEPLHRSLCGLPGLSGYPGPVVGSDYSGEVAVVIGGGEMSQRDTGRGFMDRHPVVARALRHWVRIGLCGNSLFLTLYVLLPMAIFGGVEIVEPNRVLRWCELGVCLVLSAISVAAVISSLRRMSE